MTRHNVLPRASFGTSDSFPRAAIVFSVAFLAILALMHFLEPEFDPSWRMISEYELGAYGWMMSLAFFSWGASVLSLRAALLPSLQTRIGQWWLLVIGIALFGAGIFITDPITNLTNSLSNNLHTLFGAIVIMTFPIAASIIVRGLSRHPEWADGRRRLLWATLLVWFGLIAYFGSIIVSNIVNPDAGRNGPDVLIGWPNRFMVVVYHVWIIIVALHAAQSTKHSTGTA